MPTPLQQLENNEAVLLMYAAGELPAEDRAEVEQMLASDPALRRELAEVESALAAVNAAFVSADDREPLTASEPAAVRRVSRLMAQWHVDRLLAPPAETPSGRRRIPWWVYSAASVAAVVLITVLVVVYRGDLDGPGFAQTTQPDELLAKNDSSGDKTDKNGDGIPDARQGGPDARGGALTADSPELARSFFDAESSNMTLDDAERELFAVGSRTDEASSVFMDNTQ